MAEDNARQIRCFLISGAYEHGTLPSSELSHAVSSVLRSHALDPVGIVTYTLPYYEAPMGYALRDVWAELSQAEIEALPVRLRKSLAAMLGVGADLGAPDSWTNRYYDDKH